MCIFSGDVSEVSGTQILVSKVYPAKIVNTVGRDGRTRRFKKPHGKQLQMTVYSNIVQLSRTPFDSHGRPNTAMILPFPIRPGRKNRVVLLNMENYGGIFDDMKSLFPSMKMSTNGSYTLENDSDTLKVYNIGSYQSSIVPNFESIDKIENSVFNLAPEVKEILREYYSRNYGFIVCILKNNARFHPFAYVHELRSDEKLFVPTRHFHGADTGRYLSDNKFSRFRQPLMYTDTMDTMDEYPLESGVLAKTNDISQGRGSAVNFNQDIVDDHYHDTLMLEDSWIKHQVKRRDVETTHERASVDWDHEIYVINQLSGLKNKMIKQPGFKIEFPAKNKMAHVYDYIQVNNMPKEITFGGIKMLYKFKIGKLYKGNHDVFI